MSIATSRPQLRSLAPVFVGREGEMASLLAALEGASAGGGAALVAGEPGIGKTRLLDAFGRAALARGATVVRGRCWEDAGAPPFWPWVEVLGDVVRTTTAGELRALVANAGPEIAAMVPAVAEALPDVLPATALASLGTRERFFDAVVGVLRGLGAEQPVVVLIDDLQGADPASLLLFEFVAQAARSMPLLLVGAYRDAGPLAEPLSATLESVRRAGSRVDLALRGIDREAIGALVVAASGAAAAPEAVSTLHERTSGNPLFLTELLRLWMADGGDPRALAAGIPSSLRTAIARRCRPLPPIARDVLAAGAVCGRVFDRALVSRMTDRDPAVVATALADAEVAGLVVGASTDRVRFAHAMVAEVLAAELSGAERLRLHRRAAEALVDAAGTDDASAEIAHHFAEAHDPRVIAYAHAAGDRALRLLAYEEAVRLYRVALEADAIAPAGETRRPELLLALGEAQKRAGDDRAAQQSLEQVVAIARQRGSAELLTRAALALAPSVNLGEARPETATAQLLEEAVTAWTGEDHPLHARALARLAAATYFLDVHRVTQLVRSAVTMARRVAHAGTLAWVLLQSYAVLWGIEPPDVLLPALTEAAELAEQTGDREGALYAHGWRVNCFRDLGDVAGAEAAFAECRRLSALLRQPVFDWYCESMRTARTIDEGRFDEAEQLAQSTFALRPNDMAAANNFAVHIMAIRDFQGRLAEVAPMARQLAQMSPLPAVRCVVAYVESQIGDLVEARRLFDQLAAEGFTDVPRDGARLIALTRLAEICALLDDVERAALLHAQLAPDAGRCALRGQAGPSLGPVDYYLGLLAVTLGQFDEASARFEAALAINRRIGARPLEARTLVAHARVLQRRDAPGDAAHARRLFRDARTIAHALGMSGLRAQVDQMLAAPVSGVAGNVFRRDGDCWTIVFDGRAARLPHMRGFQYLAHLLAHPAEEFHASELAAVDQAPGDAEAANRRRLGHLDRALEDAERSGDLAQHAVRAERTELRRVLSSQVRERRRGASAERARQAVTKGIKLALLRVAAVQPDLAEHLAATVRRGYFCAYLPDPRQPIEWET